MNAVSTFITTPPTENPASTLTPAAASVHLPKQHGTQHSPQQTRIMALHFPTLSSDRIMRGRAGRQWRARNDAPAPLILAHKHKNAMRLAAMNDQARGLGLRLDQGVADIKAQFPNIDIVAHNPDLDHALLIAIADWCDRYTPLVALNGAAGLFLDITGCAHLFGGEHAMARDLMQRLFEQGFAAHIAIAHTPGAAHAVSRSCNPQPVHIAWGGERQILAPFSLATLRIEPETVSGLARVGIKTIGDLMDLPRAAIARRFGRQCLFRLDQALGEQQEALSPRIPVADINAERRLATPVGHTDDIRQLIYLLAQTIKPCLEARGAGGRVFEAALFRVDGAVERLCVGTSKALRDPAQIAELFSQRLVALGDDFDAGYGYDVVRLSVVEHQPIADCQSDFAVSDDLHQDVAGLMDRIAARLGGNQAGDHPVRLCISLDSHMPHRAEQHMTLNKAALNKTGGQPSLPPQAAALAARPVRFLTRPEPVEVIAQIPEGPPLQFRWRRTTCRVVQAEGPERIAGEWWGPDDEIDDTLTPVARDYYRVEDADGRRYWIFRAGFYGAPDAPRWYMQGFFA